MRWGFHRPFNPSIKNTRPEKLEAGIWTGAFRERRSVIPMSLFYEWGAAAGGRRQAHEFQESDDDCLWIADIWEENAEWVSCYSMITTASLSVVAPIHDRMPALLRTEELTEYIDGVGSQELQTYNGKLVVTPCHSPLAKRPHSEMA